MEPNTIHVDLSKPFTLFELCPSCKGSGRAPSAYPGLTSSPGPCVPCNGRGGRQRAFAAVEKLRAYVTNVPVWPRGP